MVPFESALVVILWDGDSMGCREGREFRYKQVIVAREDLGMSPGKLAAQVAHGSLGAAEAARKKHKEWFDAWIKEGGKKVVVRASGEPELMELQAKAKELKLPCELVKDSGLTELLPGTSTVLAVGPAPSELVDKVTGELLLW